MLTNSSSGQFKAPVDLFRRGGVTKPKFDYLRTSPPRQVPQKFDVKLDSSNLIEAESGGLSLFVSPDFRSGRDWWVIPKNAELPIGFVFSKDETNGVFKGHYSIRTIENIDIDVWKKL